MEWCREVLEVAADLIDDPEGNLVVPSGRAARNVEFITGVDEAQPRNTACAVAQRAGGRDLLRRHVGNGVCRALPAIAGAVKHLEAIQVLVVSARDGGHRRWYRAG